MRKTLGFDAKPERGTPTPRGIGLASEACAFSPYAEVRTSRFGGGGYYGDFLASVFEETYLPSTWPPCAPPRMNSVGPGRSYNVSGGGANHTLDMTPII